MIIRPSLTVEIGGDENTEPFDLPNLLDLCARLIERLRYLPPAHEHTGRLGVVVVEEEAASRVERGDGGHILVGEREIEDVEILPHPLYVGRFGADDDSALNQPAQGDLRHRFAVFVTDFGQNRVREESGCGLRRTAPTT